eukprot:gb/GECG01003484.1/.p1 GENE.gb/GECG01003484.1/~~gb/GECG01003484.1/.p1  ORF type:complete len:111 (+),score=8.98 gb/GECG01003484.1/:1-333(+)
MLSSNDLLSCFHAVRLPRKVQVPLPTTVRGIHEPQQLMKYGVISSAALLDDLNNWKTLYVAGRLHKPVHIFHCGDESFRNAMAENLRHALSASLLLLPMRFTLEELFTVS